MHESDVDTTLDVFRAQGLTSEVLYLVKSGKEATVYCCQATSATGVAFLAAKVYRPLAERGFQNDAVYQAGRSYGKARETRAYHNKSRFGRAVQFGAWVAREWEVLTLLHKAGAAVPRPYAQAPGAILMQFVGDDRGPAPLLQRAALTPPEAEATYRLILDNIALWLDHNVIHADLSPYNILVWQDQITVIDLPQAVDPRFNPNARDLLARDIGNVCAYFARYRIAADPTRLTVQLWGRYVRGERLAVAGRAGYGLAER